MKKILPIICLIAFLAGCAGQKDLEVEESNQSLISETSDKSDGFVERGLFPNSFEELPMPLYGEGEEEPILYVDMPIPKDRKELEKMHLEASYPDSVEISKFLHVKEGQNTLEELLTGAKPINYVGNNAVVRGVEGFEDPTFAFGFSAMLWKTDETRREGHRRNVEEDVEMLNSGDHPSNKNITQETMKVIDTKVQEKPAYIYHTGLGYSVVIRWNDEYDLILIYSSSWGDVDGDDMSNKIYDMDVVEYFGNEMIKRIRTEEEFDELEASRKKMVEEQH